MLDEVHFAAERALAYDEVSGLKDLEAQLCQDDGHKVGVGVGKQRHVGHEAAAVITDNLLKREEKVGR